MAAHLSAALESENLIAEAVRWLNRQNGKRDQASYQEVNLQDRKRPKRTGQPS